METGPLTNCTQCIVTEKRDTRGNCPGRTRPTPPLRVEMSRESQSTIGYDWLNRDKSFSLTLCVDHIGRGSCVRVVDAVKLYRSDLCRIRTYLEYRKKRKKRIMISEYVSQHIYTTYIKKKTVHRPSQMSSIFSIMLTHDIPLH